jgi:hypothetical protein
MFRTAENGGENVRIAQRIWLVAVGALSVAASWSLAAQAPSSSTPAEIRVFADALDACKPAKASAPHLLMKAFVVEHTITGEKNALCAYSQTMPGKMTMECGFTAAGRKSMAAEIRKLADGGSMSGGTSQAQPDWAKECEIVTASGARSPMVPAPRSR